MSRNEVAGVRFGLLSFAYWLGYSSADAVTAEQARQIYRHMGTITRRMTHCAYMLASEMQSADEAFEQRRDYSDCSAQLANGNVLADQFPSYVGMIVDDVALLAAVATGAWQELRSLKIPFDGMGTLKGKTCAHLQKLDPIRHLLDELGEADSWWFKGFRRGHGVRQMLMHLHHLIEFQGSSSSEGGPLTVKAYLHEPIGQSMAAVRIEYFAEMRSILADFCCWCDRLEEVLTNLLNVPKSLENQMTAWMLPTEHSLGTKVYEAKYQVLPVCDGADSLPWTIHVEPTDVGLVLRNV